MFSGAAVNWVSGPQSLSVGNYADLQVPQGYRWVDGLAARAVLEGQNNPVPDDLIGVIAPDSGKWWAVVEFSPNGYLKDAAQFTSPAALKSAETALNDQRAKQGLSSVTSLDWQTKPVYDSQAHTLTWSIQVQTPSSKALDERLVMLGRHGILQITAVQPYPFTDAPFLKGLASDVAFKDGERYTDYQKGDKIATVGLAELITGDNETNLAAARGFGGSAAALVYAGLGACVLVGGLVVVMKRKKHHHRRSARVSAPAAAAPVVSHSHGNGLSAHAGNGNGNGSNGSSALKNGQAAVPAMAKVSLNQGQRKDSKHNRNRRRKVFDYPKFYTNVMRELSLHSYGPGVSMTNGKNSNGRSNGHANGHTNGHAHANGHSNGSNGQANGTNGNGVNEAIKSEIGELIASQKNLIQEQKLLLEQQTKLIEEKRWLIEEQTAFLKGQSEGQFPLKFE